MKKTMLMLITLTVLTVLITGCSGLSAQTIKDNPDDYVGKIVTLRGISTKSVKLGSLSGFTLEQDDGSSIPVSSKELPADGSKVTVKGTVVNDAIFKIYILASDVRD